MLDVPVDKGRVNSKKQKHDLADEHLERPQSIDSEDVIERELLLTLISQPKRYSRANQANLLLIHLATYSPIFCFEAHLLGFLRKQKRYVTLPRYQHSATYVYWSLPLSK